MQTPKTAPVHQHPDGTIHAIGSDGRTQYTIALGTEPSCTCAGWRHYGHCYHLDTARARFGAFYTVPQARARATVNLLYA